MADPLLTTLCTTCHSAPPRYRCPRCGARSCSLPCVRKHKSWASCTGIRDVTAFMPAAKLRTPAGIDHDYNFLTSIERAKDRVSRDFVQERGLFLPGEALEGKWVKRWRGEELSHHRQGDRGAESEVDGEEGVERTDGAINDKRLSHSQKSLRRAYHAAQVEVIHMPRGMARAKENWTAVNRSERRRRINWQVEWLVYEDGLMEKPTRILRKAFDKMPVYRGFSAAMDWVLSGRETKSQEEDGEEDEPPKKRQRNQLSEMRRKKLTRPADLTDSKWYLTPYPLQNPLRATWEAEIHSATTRWDADLAAMERKKLRYFLLKPQTKPKQLIPITAGELLMEALAGRSVLEFPTIYVLPTLSNDAGIGNDIQLPPDHVLGSTERRAPPESDEEEEEKTKEVVIPQFTRGRGDRARSRSSMRGRGARGGRQAFLNGRLAQSYATPIAGKKRKVVFAGIQDLDDGEINSDGEELVADSDKTSSSGSSTSSSGSDESSSEQEEQEGAALLNAIEGLIEIGGVEGLEETAKKPLVVYDSWSEDEGE